MRRLWLGLFLISAAGAVLLLSDLKDRSAAGKSARVAIFQQVSQGILDDGALGIIEGLAEEGFGEQSGVQIQRFNAEGDIGTANAIAKQLVSGQFDLVITVTTSSLQVVANANKAGAVKHVFGLVSDPVIAGVGVNPGNWADHPKHLTGLGTMQPVRETFGMARKLNPALKRVGVVWNPAEANSQANLKLARQVCQEMGIELLEANAENSTAVGEATDSVIARGAEAVWVGGDVVVVVAIDTVVASAKRARIPVFTSLPGNTSHGTLFDLGANYHEVGRLTGGVAAQVLKGTSPGDIPVRNILPQRVMFNQTVLAGLKAPWQIPADLLSQADELIDASGTHAKAGAAPPKKLTKKWRVQMVEMTNVLDVEQSEQGMLKGLEEAGLVKGTDYQITIRNAQGDMATLNALMDAAIAEGADLLLTLSTPTLQAALQRSQGKVPIVFTYVSSAVVAGAGTSRESHLPNVTGVETLGAFEDMIQLIRELMPSARRVGTLFVPAEVNMVFSKDELAKIAAKAGLELAASPVATSTEVSDAALALTSQSLDALCQVPGNMTAVSFSGIAQAALRKKIPVFAFQNVQAKEGAAVVLGRDYYDAGREAGAVAARVIRGESPAKIPFTLFSKTKLIINVPAARAAGLRLPPALLARADEVLNQ